MKSNMMRLSGALVLATLTASCADYLTGPGLTVSPNSPTSATIDQLYGSIVTSQTTQQEGSLARLSGIFVQHFSGVGNQWKPMGTYTITEGDVTTYFSRVYTGGGLVDARRVQSLARTGGDSTYAGIAMFWEALNIGTAAAIWGDMPYSEAVSDVLKPALDAQEQVYRAVLAKLDTAIQWIQKTGGNNKGPLGADLLYAGDRAKYVQAANTLKARLFMHWVEAQLTGGGSAAAATTACGGDCITLARTAALAGISTVANNLRTYHSTASTEWSIWYQFLVINRSGQVYAGKALVDTLKARRTSFGDGRIVAYFDSVVVPGGGLDFRGADRNGDGTALSVLSTAKIASGFRMPIITASENSLILAEAEFRLGNQGPALTALNAAKAFSATQHGVTVPAAGALAGAALLTEIKLEKWITMFQLPDAWSDFKRNCYPRLTPALTATDVPGRLPYGEAERQTNSNLPAVASQPARNRNDPKPCSDATHPS